jgi:hypothetical protein
MPTSTIYVADNRRASLNAGLGSDDWDELLSETTADNITTGEANTFAVRAGALSGRGGTTYRLNRWFCFFDVSSITGSNTITSATIKIAGLAVVNNGSIGLYNSTAFGEDGTETIETTDFNNVGGTSYSSNQYGSPGYSSWVSGNQSTNSFTLNATAISSMNTNGYLNIVGRNIYYDADEEETPDEDNYLGINQWEAADFNSAYRPRIEVTYSPTAVAWGEKMNGVLSNVANKYNTILSSDMSKANDVAG